MQSLKNTSNEGQERGEKMEWKREGKCCKMFATSFMHDICRELSDLGGTQRQQNLKERSCTEAAPNEETQNGAEKTSAEKWTSAEILGRGRKGNSIRPAIGSE
ncbi:hypothetical protein V6N13_024763 [Hibiscus sabdariffa]